MAAVVIGCCLLPCFVGVILAEAGSEEFRKVIEARFPDATITETREDLYRGERVTEVEFTTREGIDYEAILSESGELLHVEAEMGLPLIGGELSLGIGLRAERGLYRDVDAEYQPVPFISYENGPLEIRAYDGIDAILRLYGTEEYAVAVFGSLSLNPDYDPDDSDYLEGMDELDTLYGVGLALEGAVAGVEVGLDILQEVGDEHDGQEVEMALGYTWMMMGCEWRPELSVTWMSEKLVDYLYGVSPGEARTNRPAYSPGASYAMGVGLMIQRPLMGELTLVGIAEIATFGSEVTDSPLVDEDYEFEGVLGLMYTF